MKTWNKIQDLLSLKGKFVVSLFSVVVISLVVYSTVYEKKLPDGLTTLYLVVVGAYTANKTSLKLKDKEINFKREHENG